MPEDHPEKYYVDVMRDTSIGACERFKEMGEDHFYQQFKEMGTNPEFALEKTRKMCDDVP